MKILILATNFGGVGGAEQHIRTYARVLINIYGEHNVKILSLIANPNQKLTLFKKLKFSLNFFLSVINNKFDLIICSHLSLSFLTFMIHLVLKIPYFVITYGVEVWESPNFFEKKGILNANFVLPISNFTKCQMIKNYNISDKKLIVMPCFIGMGKFVIKEKNPDLIKKYNLENKKILLTIGRLNKSERQKGHDRVIQAVVSLVKKIPNLIYIIVGGGDDRPRLESLVRMSKLEGSVLFVGEIDNNLLVDFYNLCDIYVMPSSQEGFGIVFLEAAAFQKPVVAGNKDGSVDAVADGKTGILINPDSIQEIADAIKYLILNRDIAEKMGKAGRERVLREFSLEIMEDKLKKIIEDNLKS